MARLFSDFQLAVPSTLGDSHQGSPWETICFAHTQNHSFFMSGCAGDGNTELELYETGIVIESLVLFAFKVCVGIGAGKAVYLFSLHSPLPR